ncbi:hypothetical protein DENSPDRAFT_932393 [Dentipellis sp. KUC8613]|nr:hypothetical protein DENSPDRAFT_932393 [Dentipellis sp. KUC8613]
MGSTYRLKRKLNEEGVDLRSRQATENFCLIGTPLPPLDKRDAGEFAPLWKQEVRDEKGRRRLHGAFTGGFSAGYYNTVGSAEGWTPSTFVSSRSERAKAKAARPEDYMDEEDLAELRESQLEAAFAKDNEALGITADKQRQGSTIDDDPIAKQLREALAPSGEDTPGVRLLKKMGWRPGQGVGPRVTWRERKIQDLLAAGGTLRGVDLDALDDDGDEEAKKHMYPPRDTPVVVPSRKDDHHGLGYVKEMDLQQSLGQRGGAKEKAQQGPKLSAGFGLGALNEAEDDDIDVYDAGLDSEKTHMAWDVTDREKEDTSSLKNKSRAADTPKMVSAGFQTFDDGTPVATGFVLDPQPCYVFDNWPFAPVPEGWKPDPHRVWDKDKNKENVAVDKGGKWERRNDLQPEQRGAMLGEEAMPRSVFEFLSKKDRERLQRAAASVKAGVTPTPSAPAPAPETPSGTPFTPPNVAEAALKGFMPYPNDPTKQSRYIAYLRSQAHPEHPDLAPTQLPGQSSADFARELQDFAKSAAIFKPVSGAMASRFTSAAALDLGPKIVEGLHQPVHKPEPTPEERAAEAERRRREEGAREEAVEGSKAHAVRMGLYGPMTREVRPWVPSKLLCKRFGVRDPNPAPEEGAAGAGVGAGTGAGTAWRPEEALAEADLTTATTAIGTVPVEGSSSGAWKMRDLANVGLGEDDDQDNDILTYQRPSMDVFKAIFASDESSDEEDVEVEEGGGGKDVVGRQKTHEEVEDDGYVAMLAAFAKKDEDEDVEMAEAGPSRAGTVPAHLQMEAPTPTYAPPGASSSASPALTADTSKVDLATFKPTFVPRTERDAKKSKTKEDKDKKDKKKKDKGRAIVSFVTEEDGEEGGGLSIAPLKRKDKEKDKERERKKKRKKEKEAGDGKRVEDADGEDMWVEKPLPEAVKGLQVLPIDEASPNVPATTPDASPRPTTEMDTYSRS